MIYSDIAFDTDILFNKNLNQNQLLEVISSLNAQCTHSFSPFNHLPIIDTKTLFIK